MNSLDKQYQALLQDILDNGTKKQTRNGDTLSVFGRQIRHRMSAGFPLITTKKMYWKGIVTELIWFLRGDTNIKFLVDNDCHIWDGDAYKAYQNRDGKCYCGHTNTCDCGDISKEEFINKIKTDDEFAKKWGELGPIYGKQWRRWTKKKMYLSTDGSYENIYDEMDQTVIDQILGLINELKTNPDSRRIMVNAWNVGELDNMVLPPCHYGFQVYTRELSFEERFRLWQSKYMSLSQHTSDDIKLFETHFKEENEKTLNQLNVPTRAISLMWNQRSVDTFLGLPFNIASYGLLLEIIAKEVNMVPDELIGNLGDVHLYSNHIEQAKEQIGREFTQEEILEHLQQSGMDAANYEYRMEYVSKLPKRTREPYPLPTITLPSCLQPGSGNWDKLVFEDFYLNNYQSHPTIKALLSN